MRYRAALVRAIVWNRLDGKDDRGGLLPMTPTRCDARQARRAAVTATR